MGPLSFRNRAGELVDLPTVPATRFKNEFGSIIEQATLTGAVAITKHNATKAVLLSVAEFEALTRQLNKTFNVKMIGWSDFKAILHGSAETVEQMPHVVQRLQELWGTQEAQAYIHQILRDNRNGTRQGFPLTVVEELLLLLAILDDELGAYKPPVELSLVDMDPPEEGRADPAAA